MLLSFIYGPEIKKNWDSECIKYEETESFE